AADDWNVQLADLLAQGVAIETKQMRRPDLIAAGGPEGVYDQRSLDLAQHSIVEPGGRQSDLVSGGIGLDVTSYRNSDASPAHHPATAGYAGASTSASSTSMTSPPMASCEYNAASRRTKFSNSRTLPGQR